MIIQLCLNCQSRSRRKQKEIPWIRFHHVPYETAEARCKKEEACEERTNFTFQNREGSNQNADGQLNGLIDSAMLLLNAAATSTQNRQTHRNGPAVGVDVASDSHLISDVPGSREDSEDERHQLLFLTKI